MSDPVSGQQPETMGPPQPAEEDTDVMGGPGPAGGQPGVLGDGEAAGPEDEVMDDPGPAGKDTGTMGGRGRPSDVISGED